jgi:CDGSH iron-sulfur domain-containing protein 3
MDRPVVAQAAPYAVDVTEGDKYAWCACGLSKTQPFCDGGHKGTDMKPIVYTAEASKSVYFCGCKAAKEGPMCDGSHNSL